MSVSQSPHIQNIASCIREDGKVRCKHGVEIPPLTCRNSTNKGRIFFSCKFNRSDPSRCNFFFWLDEIRHLADWDEARFRKAYQLDLREEISGVSLSPSGTVRKRSMSPDYSGSSSSLSPKRVRHSQSDEDRDVLEEEFFMSGSVAGIANSSRPTPADNLAIPTRRNSLRTPERQNDWPMTPPSSSYGTGSHTLAETPPSPSEERARRREMRTNTSQTFHLQNFDGSMSDLSPLSRTPNTQPLSTHVTAADEIEDLLRTMTGIPDHIRKLERKLLANQGTLDGRNSRIQQLEVALDNAHRENDKLTRENERLTRENERLTRSLP